MAEHGKDADDKDRRTRKRGTPDEAARPPDRGDTASVGEPRTPFTQQVGRVVLVVLAVLFGVFAVVNAQRVSFDWIFGETQAIFTDGGEHVSGGVPLIILLVGSFLLGSAVGWLASWRRGRHKQDDDQGPGAPGK